ncbi:NnrS family protein, partial [Nitratireductor aquimarinus]
HALGGGAIGAMTLAVMMRATLGHTGRMLKAGLAGGVIFGAVCVAAIVRVWAAFEPGLAWVHISGTAWMIAFLGFALLYSPALLRARRSS